MYYIARYYKYSDFHRKYKLDYVKEDGTMFLFECGHWVTDKDFVNMIDCETGRLVSENIPKDLNFKSSIA